MHDLLTLILATIALGLYIYQNFLFRNLWKGHYLIIGSQRRKITASNNTTLTVEEPIDYQLNDEDIIR